MGKQCSYCEDSIEGDIMQPEGEGPMHPECWSEWVDEQ